MKECKHHRTISYCPDCHVEGLKIKLNLIEVAISTALTHINDGDYKAAESELNRALEG